MLGLNRKLIKLEKMGQSIKVALVGAGQMGRGMVAQIEGMKGMEVVAIADIHVDNARSAFKNAGKQDEFIVEATSTEEANKSLQDGKVVVTSDSNIVTEIKKVDVVVDATGIPDVGANVALQSILNNKHIVMLNVETDVTVGPILKKMADAANVVYTGSAGDEPGSIMELFDFAEAVNFEVVALGKGKNNKINYEATPETAHDEAISKGASPAMIASFQDGTKTMVEMTAVANATGFLPDKAGMHGPSAKLDELDTLLVPETDGGIFTNKKVVEYVDGVAPGVFAIITSNNDEVHHELQYLRLGEGPYYTLYRPYHLASLETPLSVARAYFDKEATIAPWHGMVAETVTIAKRDLKKGEYLDGIGGYTVYGKIYKKKEAEKIDALPIGLVDSNVIMINDVKKGEVVVYEDIEQTNYTTVWLLRELQNKQTDIEKG